MKGLITVLLSMTLSVTSAPPSDALPPMERLVLPNGLTVLLLPNHTNPYVEVKFISRAGSTLDPPGKEGLAALTASMLVNGTETRNEDQIAETLENMGARLTAGVDRTSLGITGSVVTLDPTHLTDFLEIFSDVLHNASFPQASFERTRAHRVASIRGLAEDHEALADAIFHAAVFTGHPEGRSAQGTLRSLAHLNRKDALAMRDRILIPAHSVLGIAGDFERDGLLEWIQENLSDLGWGQGVCQRGPRPGFCGRLCVKEDCWLNPVGARRRGPLESNHPGQRLRVLLVDLHNPGLNQVHWRLGGVNPYTLIDDEWAPFRLGTHILGGDFTSRLNTVLRVREGLTNDVRFLVDYGAWTSGPMRVSGFVNPRDLKRAIDLTIQQLKDVTSNPLETEEVNAFKAKIANAFPFKFETLSETLTQFVYLEIEGLRRHWLETYTSRIEDPRPEDIHEALQAIIPGRVPMTLVAVGNHDLIPALSAFGQVEVIRAEMFLENGLYQPMSGQGAPGAPVP